MYIWTEKSDLNNLWDFLFKIAGFVITFAVLSLPDGLKAATSLYSSSTDSLNLVYTFTYYFSWLELPLVITGLFVYRKSKIINILPVFILVLLNNVLRLPLGQSNIFELHSYEMFLIFLVGICAAAVCSRIASTQQDFEFCIDFFVVFQACTLLLNFAQGASSDGRYAALGMGPGQTATIMALYIVWFITCRNSGWKLSEKTSSFSVVALAAAFFSLLATGSRTNLLLVVAVVLVMMAWILKIVAKRKGAEIALLAFLCFILFVGLTVLALPTLASSGGSNAITRLIETNSTGFGKDSSVLGRELSIDAGWKIYSENPNGISFSLYDIEQRTYLACGMEYPHSTLLSYLLLWGPLPLAISLIYLIGLLFYLLRNKSSSSVFVAFSLLTFIWYGSPLIYARSYFILLILFTHVVRFCKGKGSESV